MQVVRPAGPIKPVRLVKPVRMMWVRGQRSVERLVAWGMRLFDRVPGARRLLTELSRVDVVDRSLAIGAQALLALLPLLVVVAAFTPPAFGASVLVQTREAMGLGDDVLAPVRQLVINEGEVRSQTGFVGLAIVLVSATSFSRALQRMYARVWDVTAARRRDAVRVSVIWPCAWLAYVQVVTLLSGWLSHLPGIDAVGHVFSFVAQVLIWWWTARVMLTSRVSWSLLLPSAVITAMGVVALVQASGVVMPRYARSMLDQFGSLGVVLASASWLVAFGGVLVVTTLVGRLLAQQPIWRDAVDRRPSRT